MTPNECEQRARRAEAHAKKVIQRAGVLITLRIGRASETADKAMTAYEESRDAARIWREIACMHPQTRARLLRTRALPLHALEFI
jgi:hypothetical protein